MPQADNDLLVQTVHLTSDHIQSGDGVLPPRYSVLIGLTRHLLPFEAEQLIEVSEQALQPTSDHMWIRAVDTTIDEVKERLPEIESHLARAADSAGAIRQAHDALNDSQLAELERRRRVERELQQFLRERNERARSNS